MTDTQSYIDQEKKYELPDDCETLKTYLHALCTHVGYQVLRINDLKAQLTETELALLKVQQVATTSKIP